MSNEKTPRDVEKEKNPKGEKKEKKAIKLDKEEIKKKLDDFRWTKKTVAIAIVILVVIVAIIAGIVFLIQRNKSDIITEKDGTQYKMAEEANLGMSNVKSINPINSTDQDTYYLARLIYDGMFELDENMIPQNNLARSYKIDKGANKITVDLVNTKFTDGKALRASDVKFTIEALKASGSNNYSSCVSGISYVETDGDNTVKIYFYEGSPMKLSALTFPILPSHRYNGVYDLIYLTDIKPVGTGKYKCKGFNSSTGMKLTPNENYHRERAKNTINVAIMSKKANKYKMTEASNISMTITKGLGREAKITQKDTKIVDFPANEVEYLGFNFTDDVMAIKNVRKAIATSIDTKSIIQECYYNSGMINDNVYYPNYMDIDSSKDKYKYNQDKAEKYLKKAGYKDRDDDGYIEDENMGEMSLTLLTSNDAERIRTAEKIQEYLEDIGIHLTVSYLEEKSYQAALKAGNFDIFLGGLKYNETMNMAEILQGTEFTIKYEYETDSDTTTDSNGTTDENSTTAEGDTNQGTYEDSTTTNENQREMVEKKSYSKTITNSNYTRYYSKKVNSLLSDMNSGLSNDEMKDKFSQMKDKLIEDLPYYCLLYKTYGAIKAPALQGTVKPVFWNLYNGAETWKSKYEVEPTEDNKNN